MSAPHFFSKMLETLEGTWLLYESITYSTTVFWRICFEKVNFAHFVSRPLGEKLVKHIFWQKWWILKPLKFQKLENANFAHFVSRLFDEKLLKHFYWQKWGILKALKFQKVKNANFAHFVSRPLGEKLPKLLFLQTGGFWKLWSKITQTHVLTKLEVFQSFETAASNAWKGKLCPFCKPPAWWKKLPKGFFWQK